MTQKRNIENLILNHLQNGQMVILKLIEALKKDRPNTTKQAVYASLRKLKIEEKILIHNGAVSLNIKWIQTMTDYFNKAHYSYTHQNTGTGSFVNMEDGEKIEYYFQNPIVADIFWTHALYILLEILPRSAPLFLYNPHEWFLIARRENETAFIRDMKERGRLLLLTTGGRTPLDQAIARDFDGTTSQYYMNDKKLFTKENYYINTIGDYVIEVWISKKTADMVEQVYKTTDKLTNEVVIELKNILEMKGKTKIVISKNSKKAERLRKMMKKNFYIPKI